MKLFSLLLIYLIASSAAAATGSTSKGIHHRKVLMQHQQQDLTRVEDRRLSENPDGVGDADNGADDAGETNPYGGGNEYHGSGIDDHHSINPESWNKLHPPKPDN
ncbi:unnamed protein product [Musa textilis]